MTNLDSARGRTDDKLRYANVHLAELAARRIADNTRGTDWERAHQEAFLYHLLGVRDGLLQEMNIAHACGLSTNQVREQVLCARLIRLERQSQALRTLLRVEGMRSTWVSTAARLRNHFTHQEDLPRRFHKGGCQDGEVFVTDPLADQLRKKHPDRLVGFERAILRASETDCVMLFTEWCAKARRLVENLRSKMPGDANA